MIPANRRAPPSPAARDVAEQPFWISFSDLMTALMVLFLVAMSVALLAITHEISQSEDEKSSRIEDIDHFMEKLKEATSDISDIVVRGRVIDFGERARFPSNSHQLTAEQTRLLREVAPRLLTLARDPLGKKWLKRIVVEGFADARGSYLYNLNLSLQRSERLLCVLLAAPPAPAALSEGDRLLARDLFLVSGSSYNALRASQEESRRIELRLEFFEIGESRAPGPDLPLEEELRCPLD
ncbi:MAG: flagellar motor protein MotB [Zoogloeaceae bacterium]|jgi:outer membrane protein OmpA-like peptidoglycan-associated protein|nr:flagellar motor protein MotB [Zoogloeaceae bacterium]